MDGGNPNEVYRDCLRNHAASLGSYATDGCGEFTLDVDVDVSDGSQLQCAACGCHRNFHRKVVSYIGNGRGLSSSSSRGREEVEYGNGNKHYEESEVDAERERREKNMKRFRSKFTGEQKEKMFGFAEKLGWKLQRKDVDEQVQSFCQGIGVTRQVFKVWMHNHKNNSSSSSSSYPDPIPPPPSLTHH